MVDTLAQAGIAADKHAARRTLAAGAAGQPVPGVPHGMLSDYQLEWLDRTLRQFPDRYAGAAAPSSAGLRLRLDQHSLRNPHQLDAVLQNFPLARHRCAATFIRSWISTGTAAAYWRRLRPASSSNRTAPTSLLIPWPGWRWLTLQADGTLHTEVNRLQSDLFRPDLDSEGY